MKKTLIIAAFILTLSIALNIKAKAHCEVPCGIYGDSVRIALIEEHIETIEKSMNQIMEISSNKDVKYNQLVRWVTNKEEHAVKLQEIVAQYFLHQRIKIAEPTDVEAYAKYTNQLALLHKLQVYAMKSKQTTDIQYIKLLRETLKKFSNSYFHTHSH